MSRYEDQGTGLDLGATGYEKQGRRSHKEIVEARTKAMYDALPQHLKDDLVDACVWARQTLMEKEGSGHDFQISGGDEGLCCSFAKPEWSGDHSGPYMSTASEAIVAAVCSYLCGG